MRRKEAKNEIKEIRDFLFLTSLTKFKLQIYIDLTPSALSILTSNLCCLLMSIIDFSLALNYTDATVRKQPAKDQDY